MVEAVNTNQEYTAGNIIERSTFAFRTGNAIHLYSPTLATINMNVIWLTLLIKIKFDNYIERILTS